MLLHPVTASAGAGTMPTARTVFGQRAQPWVNRNLFPAWIWPVVSPDSAARRSFSRTTKFWSQGSGGQRSLHHIWKQVDRGPVKDAASYYIQASESGGEPPGRWWGPGAKALGFEPGQRVEREPYDLLFGERKAP
jgi:hypothetical protein